MVKDYVGTVVKCTYLLLLSKGSYLTFVCAYLLVGGAWVQGGIFTASLCVPATSGEAAFADHLLCSLGSGVFGPK